MGKLMQIQVSLGINASAHVRCFCVCGGFVFNGASPTQLQGLGGKCILQRWQGRELKRLYVVISWQAVWT